MIIIFLLQHKLRHLGRATQHFPRRSSDQSRRSCGPRGWEYRSKWWRIYLIGGQVSPSQLTRELDSQKRVSQLCQLVSTSLKCNRRTRRVPAYGLIPSSSGCWPCYRAAIAWYYLAQHVPPVGILVPGQTRSFKNTGTVDYAALATDPRKHCASPPPVLSITLRLYRFVP